MKILIILILASILFIAEGFVFTNYPINKNSLPSSIDSFSLSNGKIVFSQSCSSCHGLKAEGSFGPNLTDNSYLHGHHYQNMMHVIKHGVKSKGMTAFGHHLTHAQIRDVAHYVLSLKGSNPQGAKAPQGKACKY